MGVLIIYSCVLHLILLPSSSYLEPTPRFCLSCCHWQCYHIFLNFFSLKNPFFSPTALRCVCMCVCVCVHARTCVCKHVPVYLNLCQKIYTCMLKRISNCSGPVPFRCLKCLLFVLVVVIFHLCRSSNVSQRERERDRQRDRERERQRQRERERFKWLI